MIVAKKLRKKNKHDSTASNKYTRIDNKIKSDSFGFIPIYE